MEESILTVSGEVLGCSFEEEDAQSCRVGLSSSWRSVDFLRQAFRESWDDFGGLRESAGCRDRKNGFAEIWRDGWRTERPAGDTRPAAAVSAAGLGKEECVCEEQMASPRCLRKVTFPPSGILAKAYRSLRRSSIYGYGFKFRIRLRLVSRVAESSQPLQLADRTHVAVKDCGLQPAIEGPYRGIL